MRKILLLAAGLFLPLAVLAQGQPIKIGVLMPYTGVFAVVGQDATKGLELYLEKVKNRAGGREIQVIKEDEETKPDVGLTKTKKLVERDRVDVLVGPVTAGVAIAMRDYVHTSGIPLIITTPGVPQLTAPPMASPWIFRVTDTHDMSNYSLGTWVAKKTKHRRMVIVASDFVAGRHSASAFASAFKAGGGEIVKEIYIPLNTADFAPYLPQLADIKADAVYAWFAGADAIRFVRSYKTYGLSEKLPLLGYASLVDDIILPAQGDSALGIIASGHYTAMIGNPDNRAFVKEYEAKYKSAPTRYSEQGYVAAQLIVAAANALKGDVSNRANLREEIKNAAATIKPPRGPMQFDRYQQAVTAIYFTRVEKDGNRLVNRIVDQLPDVSQQDTWKWWVK
jgi:branched-chain amino acid transport system substrate-binding protein